MTNSCAIRGGCASDYVAVGITCLTFILVFNGILFILMKRRELEMNAKRVSVLLVQAFASVVYVCGVLMSKKILRLSHHPFWQNCYLWQIWLEGPFGFGLLLTCHIVRAYRLPYLFIKRRLPPLNSYQLITILLLPWFTLAAFMQGLKVVDKTGKCGIALGWQIAICCLHVAYPIILLLAAWQVRRIRFEFNEFKELLKGSIVCGILLLVWGGLSIAEKIDTEVIKSKHPRLRVTARFIIILLVNLSVLLLFWIPIACPFSEFLQSLKSRQHKYCTMGQVLGVPHSGVVPKNPSSYDFSKPLEYLLEDRKFRQSYAAFADSRMAGEIVHFYDEVRELNKIPTHQVVQRVYMAEHVIDKYIKSGAPMEINISHKMRSDILNTKDLADPDLFKRAVNEALRMMQMNLSDDYWKSSYYQDLKAELEADAEAQYMDHFDEHTDVNKKHVMLSTLRDFTTDNPFDIPFSGELPKETISASSSEKDRLSH